MNRYDVFQALSQVDEAHLEAAERFLESGKEPAVKHKTIRSVRVVLLAAAITALLAATAYAAGLFGLRWREVAPEETFPVHFSAAWDKDYGAWKGTYALEFDSPLTCQPVRYRFGWLPDDLSFPVCEKDADGWVKHLDPKPYGDDVPWYAHVEAVKNDTEQFFISDMYYAPQFADGGALILLNQVPDQVSEETWGELMVQTFTCSTWRDWKTGDTGDYDVPVNHVVLFHPEQGWIFAIRGTLPPEDLVKIARSIEVEQTEGLVEQSQFSNPYDTFDAGQG